MVEFMEKTWIYRIVPCSRKEKKNLDRLVPFRAKRKSAPIIITNWQNWEHSLYVKINVHGRFVILDSGVIEELAAEIKRIKRERKLGLELEK